MNFLDILITSPQYFHKKSMGTRNENLVFDMSDEPKERLRGRLTKNRSTEGETVWCVIKKKRVPWPKHPGVAPVAHPSLRPGVESCPLSC